MTLTAKRILVVEDEPLIAFDLADMLQDEGAEVVGPAFDLATGEALVRENSLDAALLDIDLGDALVWPIAELLMQHGTPFAFVSARCTADQVPPAFHHSECVMKPAMREKVFASLGRMLG